MSRILSYLICLTLMSSCATIQKNGYYQTRHYSWHKKKKKEPVNRRVEEQSASEVAAFIVPPKLERKVLNINSTPIASEPAKVKVEIEYNVKHNVGPELIEELVIPEVIQSSYVAVEEQQAIPDRRRHSRIHWLVYASVITTVLAPILFFVPVAAISTMGVVLGVAGILSAGLCLFLMKKREIRKNGKELVYASLIIGAAFFSSILIMLSLMSIFISVAT